MTRYINFVLSLLSIVFLSCQNEAQNKKTTTTANPITNPDFFQDVKEDYYTLIIDGSNVSDHPLISHLDCTDAYLTIHFIPKSDSLGDYWKKKYFTTYNFNNFNQEKDHQFITDQLKNIVEYNVFAFEVKKDYFDLRDGCTEESLNLKKGSTAQIYLFNPNSNSWKQIKQLKTNLLPPYADAAFFKSNFPHLFPSVKSKHENDNIIELSKKDAVMEMEVNFNKDDILEKIIVLKNTKSNDTFSKEHFNLPIRIYQNDKLWKSNDYLIANSENSCVSEGFSDIKVKNNYFTIEQQLCIDYQILVSSFTTFQVINNEIYLSGYGETYFDKSNHERDIPEKTFSEKDFGKIKFENVTSQFLRNLK